LRKQIVKEEFNLLFVEVVQIVGASNWSKVITTIQNNAHQAVGKDVEGVIPQWD